MAPQSGQSFRSILGVPPSQPNPTNSVFIIVDAQNEYDHGKLAISDVASSRAVIEKTLGKYREAKGDVVHVLHATSTEAPLFTTGTELAEEFVELKPKEGEEVWELPVGRRQGSVNVKKCGLRTDRWYTEDAGHP